MATRVSPTYNTTQAITAISGENATNTTGESGNICTLGGVSMKRDLAIRGNLFIDGDLIINAGTTFVPTITCPNCTFAYTTQLGYKYVFSGFTYLYVQLVGTVVCTTDSNPASIITNTPIAVSDLRSATGFVSPPDLAGSKAIPGNNHPYSIGVSSTNIYLFKGNTPVVFNIATTSFNIKFVTSVINV